MIPPFIHRIWLEDAMPHEFRTYGEEWEELHPYWDVIDWKKNVDLPSLVNQNLFENAKKICPNDWKRFQSDLVRLELLYQFGGIYVDTDCQPLKAFDELREAHSPCFVAWSPHRDKSNNRILTNAVMAAEPRHPWIKICIDQMADSVKRHKGKHLAQVTGPHHITQCWNLYEQKREQHRWPEVVVLPSRMFYPQNNAARDRGETPDLSESWCWHRWNNTLRKQGKGLA